MLAGRRRYDIVWTSTGADTGNGEMSERGMYYEGINAGDIFLFLIVDRKQMDVIET